MDITASPVTGAQSVRRAIALLRRFAEVGREGKSAAELAAETGVDRTTTHRILRCMVEEGLLSSGRVRGRYALGPLAYELGLAAGEQINLATICRPVLARIAARTEDTVFLMARAGFDAVCLERVEGSYPVKTLVVNVGSRRPLGIGAGGLAVLSALRPDESEEVILQNAARIPGMTVERLRKLVARTSQKQFASLDVTGIPGVRAIAVAVRTPSGRPIAALSVAAVTSRMAKERQSVIVEMLRRESSGLTAELERGNHTI